MMRIKPVFSGLLLAFFLLFAPQVMAGGKWQQKIESRLNVKKDANMQFGGQVNQEDYGYSKDGEVDENQCPEATPHAVSASRKRSETEVIFSGSERNTSPAFSSYAVYRTRYKAEIEEDVVCVSGHVVFEVFRKGWTRIALVKSNVGLIDVTINRGASFVVESNGRYDLMVDKPGRYNLDIEFLIKASRERENGPGSFSFEVLPAPISQFEFVMPETGVEIFVEPSIKTEVRKEGAKTIAWAVMPNTGGITVRWTKALPKETIAKVELEPKIYADTETYASVGEGLIRCQTALRFSILQAEVSNLRMLLPEDVSLLDVQGRDLRDWKVVKEKGQQYLDVYFNFGLKGDYRLNLTYERGIGEGSVVAEIPSARVVGAEREKGYVALAAATNVELAVNKIQHANLIDVKELPQSILRGTSSPVLLAFKYLSHPYNISIDVTRHEELPVLVAAIDSLECVTLATEEGKVLTKALYKVRNNVKQFLRLQIPDGATLWSVFVSGKPVKPAKDKNGSILVPLEKSQLSGESLAQFPVELVYLDERPKLGWAGHTALYLTRTDLPISELTWSIYLPWDYGYFNFGGDVKRVESAVPFLETLARGAAGEKSAKAKQNQGRYPNGNFGDYRYGQEAVQADVATSQFSSAQEAVSLKQEMGKIAGMLPIRISIPEQGRLYRFSKLLITEKERPWFSVRYVKSPRFIKPLLWIFGILLLIFIFGRSIVKKYGSNNLLQ